MGDSPASLTCQGVSVCYGEVAALRSVSLEVAHREVVALLGPSGSGKTTLLHAAAGFVPLSAGLISIAEREVSRPGWMLPPEKRAIGLVFQSYALWPHLSALETVAYPLRRRGIPRREALKEAGAWLDRVGLGALNARRPGELSGGEQQRVGLARALASSPALFLLDEPTANLDATLKGSLQQEIGEHQRATGAGSLYVTHDPAEAFAVADRVAVLRAGRLLQVGSPAEVYASPADAWVAALTGVCSMVREVEVLGPRRVRIRDRALDCVIHGVSTARAAVVRPEWIALAGSGLALGARVTAARFQGSFTDYVLASGADRIVARQLGPPAYRLGEPVTWEPRELALVAGELDAPGP